jgi:serine/threonine protein phosphatase PrpC
MNRDSTNINAQLTSWLLRRTAMAGVRRVASLNAAIATDVGSIRKENQDRVAIARGTDVQGRAYMVMALADGMGGMRDGAECAAIALGSFFASIHQAAANGSNPSSWLAAAALHGNASVYDKYRGAGGATLVAALVIDKSPVRWLSVGDSRVHLLAGTALSQLSQDDTIAGQLGKPTAAGLDRSSLLQFIGIGDQLEPHIGVVEREGGGTIFLTSDGVHFIDAAWLAKVAVNAPDPGTCARRLTELAKWCGGPDNASVGIVTFEIASDPSMHFGVAGLEIWDPFGDLQLISLNAPQQVSKLIAPIVQREEPPIKATGGKSGATAPKSRGKSPSRKTKGGDPKATVKDDETPDVSPPQLVMEFPNKSA